MPRKSSTHTDSELPERFDTLPLRLAALGSLWRWRTWLRLFGGQYWYRYYPPPADLPVHAALLDSHRYAEALAAYDAQYGGLDQRRAQMTDRGKILLCLGRLDDALSEFQNREAIDRVSPLGRPDAFARYVGAVFWLLGRRQDAILMLRSTASDFLSGRIEYSDASGGAEIGLLLWYAGVTAMDSGTTQQAIKYLEERAKVTNDVHWTNFSAWPGPLALCALGRMPFEEALQLNQRFANMNFDQLKERAKTDRLVRSDLAHALFYQATRKRSVGDELGCRRVMAQCAALENPIGEITWYLARAEAAIGSPFDMPEVRLLSGQ